MDNGLFCCCFSERAGMRGWWLFFGLSLLCLLLCQQAAGLSCLNGVCQSRVFGVDYSPETKASMYYSRVVSNSELDQLQYVLLGLEGMIDRIRPDEVGLLLHLDKNMLERFEALTLGRLSSDGTCAQSLETGGKVLNLADFTGLGEKWFFSSQIDIFDKPCSYLSLAGQQQSALLSEKGGSGGFLTGRVELLFIPPYSLRGKREEEGFPMASLPDEVYKRLKLSGHTGGWDWPPYFGKKKPGLLFPGSLDIDLIPILYNEASTREKNGKPILTLKTAQGVSLMMTGPQGRRWQMILSLEQAQEYLLGVEDSEELLNRLQGAELHLEFRQAIGTLLPLFEGMVHPDDEASVIRHLLTMLDEPFTEERQSFHVPGILSCPLIKRGGSQADSCETTAGKSAASSGSDTRSRGVNHQLERSDDQPGGSDSLLHTHLWESKACQACSGGPCQCPECACFHGLPSGTGSNLTAESVMASLQEVKYNYVEIAIHLGLPVEFILSLLPPYDKADIINRQYVLMLEKRPDLRFYQLKEALSSVMVNNPGLAHQVQGLVELNGLTLNDLINQQSDEFIQALAELLSCQNPLGVNVALGDEIVQFSEIQYDSFHDVSLRDELFLMLQEAAFHKFTVSQLVDCLNNPPIGNRLQARKLAEWALTRKIALGRSLYSLGDQGLWEIVPFLVDSHPSDFRVMLQLSETTELNRDSTSLLRLLKAAENTGRLTRRALYDALGAIQNRRMIRKMGLADEFDDLTVNDHWNRLLEAHNNQQPLPLGSVYSLLTEKKTAHDMREFVVPRVVATASIDPHGIFLVNFLESANADRGWRMEDLMTLAKLKLIPAPEWLGQWQPGQVAAASRPLALWDLLPFALIDNSFGFARQIAAILGVNVEPHELRRRYHSGQALAMATWKRILSRIPHLQTGHLKQLLMQHGFERRVALLPARDATENPSVPLGGLSLFAAEVKNIALEVSGLEPAVLMALMQQLGLQQKDDSVPLLTELLHHLARSAKYFKPLYAFLDRQYKQPGSAMEPVRVSRLLLEGTPPDSYICPITLELMKDPVPVQTGSVIRYFSKEALLEALSISERHPLTRERLSYQSVLETPESGEHAERIREWSVQNPDYVE